MSRFIDNDTLRLAGRIYYDLFHDSIDLDDDLIIRFKSCVNWEEFCDVQTGELSSGQFDAIENALFEQGRI